MPGRSPTHLVAHCVAAGVCGGAFAALSARPAAAHEVGGTRFDAPLPLPLVFLGAGATVALTALWLARTDVPRVREDPTVRLERPAVLDPVARWVVRPLFGLVVAAAVLDGLFGRQVAAENAATLFVWPVWFHGLALVALVVGTPWPLLSPWQATYRLLVHVEGATPSLRQGYPDGLAEWPALVGFLLLFGVADPLTVIPTSPRSTAVVVAIYAATMLGGAIAIGPAWLRRADPLGVLYRLLGRVAPISVSREDRTVTVALPWRGCRRPVETLALAAFVVATVYTVSFDGFTSTRTYRDVLAAVRDAAGTDPVVPVLVFGHGLALFLVTFAATTALAERVGRAAGDADCASTRAAVRAFAPTVLPIAAAYEIAHNYPYVLGNLGELWPVAIGSLVPAADPLSLLGWLSLPAFWWSQVALVVGGHVVAVVAAHGVAMDRYDTPTAGRRAHLPLVGLMVAYTVLSLWIVSQPIVS